VVTKVEFGTYVLTVMTVLQRPLRVRNDTGISVRKVMCVGMSKVTKNRMWNESRTDVIEMKLAGVCITPRVSFHLSLHRIPVALNFSSKL
jgi:hypothetical protein